MQSLDQIAAGIEGYAADRCFDDYRLGQLQGPMITTIGAAYGGATAIGISLNVVTVGSNNTVVVNSTQTNNGNQNASVSLNGSSAQ